MTHLRINATEMGFAGFGNGAFLGKGTPVVFQMDNCTPTYWVRALDGQMQTTLDEAGIDFDELNIAFDTVEVTLLDEHGAPVLNDDGEAITVKKREATESGAKWTVRTLPVWKKLAKLMIEKYKDLKREDGSLIECNDDTIEAHGGYADFMLVLMKAAKLAAQVKAKNSDSSPDGKSDEQAETGDDTSQPVPETT